MKKSKKRPKKVSQFDLPGLPPRLVDVYDDIELSEEFLTTILKYINDLCDIISNGDPNLERKVEVIQNLNNDVTCYRNELDVKKQMLEELNDQEYYSDWSIYDMENVNAYEKDKVGDIGQPLKKKSGKYKHKKVENISIGTTVVDTQLTNEFSIDNEKLFPYLKYNVGNGMFGCCLCDASARIRNNLFRHIKAQHKDDIKIKLEDINKQSLIGKCDNESKIKDSCLNSEPKVDCSSGTCRKLYGESYQQLWCKKCKDIPKIPLKRKQSPKKIAVCTICGKSTNNVKLHSRTVHEIDKQKCPHCDKVLQNPIRLKEHLRKVHEKVPCAHCGKFIPVAVMGMHIQAQHTSNDNKRHKCDNCGKGFTNIHHLNDHKNIHTGEKPYKCKYCSACFASKGNHTQHEKSHLGHRRKKV